MALSFGPICALIAVRLNPSSAVLSAVLLVVTLACITGLVAHRYQAMWVCSAQQ